MCVRMARLGFSRSIQSSACLTLKWLGCGV